MRTRPSPASRFPHVVCAERGAETYKREAVDVIEHRYMQAPSQPNTILVDGLNYLSLVALGGEGTSKLSLHSMCGSCADPSDMAGLLQSFFSSSSCGESLSLRGFVTFRETVHHVCGTLRPRRDCYDVYCCCSVEDTFHRSGAAFLENTATLSHAEYLR